MSETKWTPGPWKISRYTNYEGFSISADNAGCIAERWWPSRALDIPIEANAQLIAAAPDLYEALAAFESVFKANGPVEVGGGLPVHMGISKAVSMAVGALAKARGEA